MSSAADEMLWRLMKAERRIRRVELIGTSPMAQQAYQRLLARGDIREYSHDKKVYVAVTPSASAWWRQS